ncbi:MAG: hypothetical protein ACSHWZ_17605 [Sulfitobacter sp.]
MRLILLTAALFTAAQTAQAGNDRYTRNEARPIYVNCYRGPLEAVIWDRPQGTFVQDLVDYGYDHANANAIATLICTDKELIGNSERIKQALLREIRKNPPARQRRN